MIPGLEEQLVNGSEENVTHVVELVGFSMEIKYISIPDGNQIQKGASSARSDDTKSLKGAVLDWLTPRGQSLNPPLSRNVKTDRGFYHERTGALLCPVDLDGSDTE